MAKKKRPNGRGGRRSDGGDPAAAASGQEADEGGADEERSAGADEEAAQGLGRPARPRFAPHLPALKWQVALAVLAGVLHGLSQPLLLSSSSNAPLDPSGYSGLLCFVAYLPLLFCIRDTTIKRAFWLGWVFLIVKYTIVLYWVTVAMTVFGGIPAPIALVALTLLAAAISSPLAACIAGSRMLAERYGWPYWILLPMAFAGGEFVRNYGFLGGFPWGNVGYSLATVPLLLQTAALVGIYGLVFLIVLVNTSLNEVITALVVKAKVPRAPLFTATGILGFMVLFGAWRLHSGPEEAAEKTLKVALLQGNIEQGIKNEERLHRETILERYWELQARAIDEGAELVVWPEAAVPFNLRADADSLEKTAVIPMRGQWVGRVPPSAVIGASASLYSDDPETGKRVRKRFNTAFATDDNLRVKGRFDKVHLVPFGEYVPWPFGVAVRHLVPGLTTPGESHHAVTLETPKGPLTVGATICYEGAFPEITAQYVDDGADLMVNVTNDAWYGVSSAPWQHFLMYAVRAVESGRPVIRAANTGLSGWVDTRGRVHDLTDLYETTYRLVDVPLVTADTLYQRVGDLIGPFCVVVILGLWFYCLAGFHFWRRQRHVVEWAVGGAGLALATWTGLSHHIFFPPGTDDAASTQNQLQFIFGVLIGLGALSGRPWGRWAQVTVGLVTFGLGAAGILFGSWGGVLPGLVALAVGVVAFVRKGAYDRPADVPVVGPFAPGGQGLPRPGSIG